MTDEKMKTKNRVQERENK